MCKGHHFKFLKSAVKPLYNGNFVSRSFLATFCCNMEIFLFQRLNVLLTFVQCWDQNFCPYVWRLYFYCILDLVGLLREVPLY